MSININDVDNFFKGLNERLLNIVKYILKCLIFVFIGIMVMLPIILKNTKLNNNDVTIFKKSINVLSIEGKTNIKVINKYINTGLTYSEYSNYVEKYNKSNLFKKSIILELNLLFLLFEIICLYYIVVNVIKLFIEKEDNEYFLYATKKSFAVNTLSFLIISLIRRFIFRNTIFASLNTDLMIIYAFSILIMLAVYKIVEMDKIDIKKAIQNEKYKKNK